MEVRLRPWQRRPWRDIKRRWDLYLWGPLDRGLVDGPFLGDHLDSDLYIRILLEAADRFKAQSQCTRAYLFSKGNVGVIYGVREKREEVC